MSNIPTPHISANAEDFAPTVLMPGDPLRAKFIAENFLDNARLVNNVRGIQGYTGTYKGKPVSVMASGMGMPSIGIYAYELFNFYSVEKIIRVGTAGGIADGIKLRDVVIASSCSYCSAFIEQYGLPGTYSPTADFSLLESAVCAARAAGIEPKVGNILSSDAFYGQRSMEKWKEMGVLAVEMECAALYATAAKAGKKALCICTVSDLVFGGESCSAEERQNTFTAMMKIALETA